MISRKYNKSIEIYKSTANPDGYGGNLADYDLDYTMWAFVKTKTAGRIDENGQSDNYVQTTFIVRNRVNLDINPKEHFVLYNGLIYSIDAVLNKDLDNIDIEIQTTQRV